MRLTLSKSGGFAGIQRPPVTVDTTDLSTAEAERLRRLLDEARFFDLPKRPETANQPDRFQYKLQVVPDKGTPRTLTFDESNAPAPLLELVRSIPRTTRKRSA